MPSLKLPNPFRRGADRPSLKERAADLKTAAAHVMRRPRASGTSEAAASGAQMLPSDAALIALEAEFRQADREYTVALDALTTGLEQYIRPPMPKELRVWRNDWIMRDIPRTRTLELADGSFRSEPYGNMEVQQMRGLRCTRPSYGQASNPLPDERAQERVDGIVAAWDRWRAEVDAAEIALHLPGLRAVADEAEDRRFGVLERIRSIPAKSLEGLGIKARIAETMYGGGDIRSNGLEMFTADEVSGLTYDLLADTLALTGKKEA